MAITHEIIDGIAEVVVSYPPVNAIPVQGWFELGSLIKTLGEASDTRAVILRADGRGFNAGVDIKEMQETEGFDALLGANRGCWEAFRAVYECKVPVITAAHGYCVGGGIGLAGNSDIL
ncbi:MAG: enoyl-CoA hydratase-related protein, partial [Myxococcota bacterium]